MSIRALKLNLRTTLCFGVVCLLLLIQGAMTLIKVDKVYSSTVDIETNWLPSIRLGGEIDAAFINCVLICVGLSWKYPVMTLRPSKSSKRARRRA
jgi:hypothetical protein